MRKAGDPVGERGSASMRLVALCAFVLAFAAAASPQPPEIRYWPRPAGADALSEVAERQAPARIDPKLLVLIYHNLVFGRTGDIYNRDLYNFEHDLDFLTRNFRVIDFAELLDMREGRTKAATDVAVITFDDGDLSVYAIAYPLLKEYRLPATFFVIPAFVGTVGYMDWQQIREMSAYRDPDGRFPFSFESHSLTHRRLGELGADELRRELAESKRAIEEVTGREAAALALPFGSGAGDRAIIGAARELGYRIVRGSVPAAQGILELDPFDVRALSVENYSSDRLVREVLRLTGR